MMHDCHAVDCDKQVDSKYFMCFKHWAMVRKDMQNEIWRTFYATGPMSPPWIEAANKAIRHVAEREGISVAKHDLFEEPEYE
jgi:hypothetical protein